LKDKCFQKTFLLHTKRCFQKKTFPQKKVFSKMFFFLHKQKSVFKRMFLQEKYVFENVFLIARPRSERKTAVGPSFDHPSWQCSHVRGARWGPLSIIACGPHGASGTFSLSGGRCLFAFGGVAGILAKF